MLESLKKAAWGKADFKEICISALYFDEVSPYLSLTEHSLTFGLLTKCCYTISDLLITLGDLAAVVAYRGYAERAHY